MTQDPIKHLRELAWLGDAVLELYARRWILREHGRLDAEAKTRFTRNSFLNSLDNPTRLEAKIGEVYQAQGIEAAETWIREHVEPLFLKQEAKRKRQGRA